MAGRYTSPVRFVLKGNKKRAQQLIGFARGLIDRLDTPVAVALDRKYFHRTYQFTGGVNIKLFKSHGQVQCIIYVPPTGDFEYPPGFGYVIYPALGWTYQIYDSRYWNYNNPDPYSLHTIYENHITSVTPSFLNHQVVKYKPRWMVEDEVDENPPNLPLSYKAEVIKGEDTYAEYLPDYKTYHSWKNADYTLHWAGIPTGDLYDPSYFPRTTGFNMWGVYPNGYVEQEEKRVFVNGYEYKAPAKVWSAGVQHDDTTNTDWLVITSYAYIDFEWTDQLRVFAKRITTADDRKSRANNNIVTTEEFVQAGEDNDPDLLTEIENGWVECSNGAITLPLENTWESWYPTLTYDGTYLPNDGWASFYGTSWGFKFRDTDAERFVCAHVLEYDSCTQMEEASVTLSIWSATNGTRTWYTADSLVALEDYDRQYMTRQPDDSYVGGYVEVGTIYTATGYRGGIRRVITQKIERHNEYRNGTATVQNKWGTTEVKHTWTAPDATLTTEMRRQYENLPLDWTCLDHRHSSCGFFAYYDIATGDRVEETATSIATNPGTTYTEQGGTDYDVTYNRDVYVDGTLLSNNSGSYHWTRGPYISGLPECPAYHGRCNTDYELIWNFPGAPPSHWSGEVPHGGLMMQPYGSFNRGYDPIWNIEGGIWDDVGWPQENRYNIHSSVRGPGFGHLIIHYGWHPEDWFIGSYVARSVNAGPDGVYDYKVSHDEVDCRIERKHFASGHSQFLTHDYLEMALGLEEQVDADGMLIKPLVNVSYFRDDT